MGMYDSIYLDGIEWQTKALGKGLASYRPGDPVRVQRVPNSEEYKTISHFDYESLPDRYLVSVYARGYLLVKNGKVARLATAEEQSELFLDRFDSLGCDEHDDRVHIFGGQRPPRVLIPRPAFDLSADGTRGRD